MTLMTITMSPKKNNEEWLVLFLGGVCYVGGIYGIGCAVALLVVVCDTEQYYWNQWLKPCLTFYFILAVLSIPMLLVLNRPV
tara:strand:- start:3 stop:248 length:246 start_codon:yes stop_codon:yes gene_type:complete